MKSLRDYYRGLDPEKLLCMQPNGKRVYVKDVIGKPFVRLPGDWPFHKVLAFICGQKVRVSDVELVWNDMLLVDTVFGDGEYERTNKAEEGNINCEVLSIAQELYHVADRAQARKLWAEGA